jgi:hypothetical protein
MVARSSVLDRAELCDTRRITSESALVTGPCRGYLYRDLFISHGERDMPKRTVKEVSTIVRDYFDSVRTSKFTFDVLDVAYDEKDDQWSVECQLSKVSKESPIRYLVTVDDESGEILEVKAQEESQKWRAE